MTVSPNPLLTAVGGQATVTVSWTGLTADTPYLGYISYEGSPSRTYVAIS